MNTVTVVGGGLAGLVASITCAEAGAKVRLYEARHQLGGRARTSTGSYRANEGPHVLYADGPWWPWLRSRDLLGEVRNVSTRGLARVYFRSEGRLVRLPPAGVVRLLLAHRTAPVDQDFFSWVAERHGVAVARAAANMMGVATFHPDPGQLSAAFVWERMRRVFAVPPRARYVVGGWGTLIDRLAARAADLGVRIDTGVRVNDLPEGPVVVATSLDAASRLLRDPSLSGWPSGRTALLDLGLRASRRDVFLVSDLDQAGWLERYSLPDPSLAPPRRSLVQAQVPLLESEGREAGVARAESLVDLALPGWRTRVEWRRDAVAHRRTGALDFPGYTWRDRPAVDRGHGVFLAGDMVAAPGLLSEVSYASGVAAAAGAVGWLTEFRRLAVRGRSFGS